MPVALIAGERDAKFTSLAREMAATDPHRARHDRAGGRPCGSPGTPRRDRRAPTRDTSRVDQRQVQDRGVRACSRRPAAGLPGPAARSDPTSPVRNAGWASGPQPRGLLLRSPVGRRGSMPRTPRSRVRALVLASSSRPVIPPEDAILRHTALHRRRAWVAKLSLALSSSASDELRHRTRDGLDGSRHRALVPRRARCRSGRARGSARAPSSWSQAPLASTRISISSPDRVADGRESLPIIRRPDLDLHAAEAGVDLPSAASAAAAAGATAAIVAFTGTGSTPGRAEQLSDWTSPARRPARSQSARSTAASACGSGSASAHAALTSDSAGHSFVASIGHVGSRAPP